MGRALDLWKLSAIRLLGNGVSIAGHLVDALAVQQAELSILRRIGRSEGEILIVQGNLANTYTQVGLEQEALQMRHDVYFGRLKLLGGENHLTLVAADNYALSLITLQRLKEAVSLMRRALPVAKRVLGASNELTIRMVRSYAWALYADADATLDDLREAVKTLEDAERIARRVLGGAHPVTIAIELNLQDARAALRARETPPTTTKGNS